MVRVLHTPLGFQPQGVTLADVDFSLEEGRNVPLETKKAMLEAVRNIPGVTAVGAISRPPLHRLAARFSGFRARDGRTQR